MTNKDAFIARWGHDDPEFVSSVEQLLAETLKEERHDRALDKISVEGVAYKFGIEFENMSVPQITSAVLGEVSRRWATKNKLDEQRCMDCREVHFALSWLYDVVSEHCLVPDPQYASVTNAASTITKFQHYAADDEDQPSPSVDHAGTILDIMPGGVV